MNEIRTLSDLQNIDPNLSTTFYLTSLNIDSEKLFIIVRNLCLQYDSVFLNFDNFNQIDIEKLIVDYLTTDIEVQVKSLDLELSKRISEYLKCVKVEDNQLIYTGIYQQFFEEHWSLIENIARFLSSSIYYASTLISKKSEIFSNLPYVLIKSFKQNVMSLFNVISEFEVDLMLKKYELNNYLWFDDNKYQSKFASLLKTSKYALFLYGQSTPQWQLFQKLFSLVNH